MVQKIWEPRPDIAFGGDIYQDSKIRMFYSRAAAERSPVKGVLDRKRGFFIARKKKLTNVIPVMVNERGQVVCIPLGNDEPTIGIVGQRRQGKTLMYLNILGHAYYNCKMRCGIISDTTGETGTWGKQNSANIFMSKLHKFSQTGAGLPIVCLYPHVEGGILPRVKHSPIVEVSYSFDDFLKYPDKLKEMGHGGDYFDGLIEDITKFKDENQGIGITDLLSMIENRTIRKQKKDETLIEKGGLPPPTSNKLKNMFISLWKKKIFDVTTDIPSKLTLQTKIDSYVLEPFSACLAANLIPSLLTAQLQQELYYKNYFQNFLERIYYQQTRPGNIFSDNQLKIWLFCDEMNNIPKLPIIEEMFRTGGPNRIGFVWSAQQPSKMSDSITTQTKYYVIFKPNTEDLKRIKENYGLTSAQVSRIRNQEKFQCTLVSQEPVYIYDPKMNTLKKDTITENPQFGGMIFPFAQPKSPADEVGGVEI